MNKQEPQPFDAYQFKAVLKQRIMEVLPENEEEADKFAESGAMQQVGNSAMGQVQAEKQKAGGAIEGATKQPLNPNAVPPEMAENLDRPHIGRQPQVNAENAMPKPLSTEQVEAPLEQSSEDIETQMEENEVTDEHLINSDDPQFLEALDAKNEVKTHSEESKQQFRDEENQQLLSTRDEAMDMGMMGMETMFGNRKDALMGMYGQQQQSGQEHTDERTRISNEINAIYDKTKADVEGILGNLDKVVGSMFQQASDSAGKNFDNYIATKMAAYKQARYSGTAGWLVAGYDYFAGLP